MHADDPILNHQAATAQGYNLQGAHQRLTSSSSSLSSLASSFSAAAAAGSALPPAAAAPPPPPAATAPPTITCGRQQLTPVQAISMDKLALCCLELTCLSRAYSCHCSRSAVLLPWQSCYCHNMIQVCFHSRQGQWLGIPWTLHDAKKPSGRAS